MYNYRVVIPAQLADEVENLVRSEADVSLEGLISTPEEVVSAGNVGSAEPDQARTTEELKDWLEQQAA